MKMIYSKLSLYVCLYIKFFVYLCDRKIYWLLLIEVVQNIYKVLLWVCDVSVYNVWRRDVWR